jgi:predicted PurR-regulated permease PerM
MDDVVVSLGLRTIVTSILVAVGVVAAAVALHATRNVGIELTLAVGVAVLARPAVLWLARRTPFGIAVVAVFVALLAVLVAFLAGEAHALAAGTDQLRRAVPDRLARLQSRLPAGNPLRRFLIEDDVVARVRHDISGIPSRFILGTDSPAGVASRLGTILLVSSLGALMVVQGPTAMRSALARLPGRWQDRAQAAVRAGYHLGGSYVRRTAVLALACGLGAGLIAAACGVPGAAVLALWLGMWAFVPKLGIAAGGLPLLALAVGQGVAEGIGASVALVVLVGAGEWARRRWIERTTLTVGSLLSLLAVMTGMELARWPGALVALLGVAVVVAGAQATPRRQRATPDPTPSVAAPVRPPASSPDGVARPRRFTVEIDGRSLVLGGVLILTLVAAVALARSVPEALTRATVGVLVALAVNPIVGALQRRLHVARAAAVGIVVGGLFVAVLAFAVLAVPQAIQQSHQLSKEAPHLVSQLDRAPGLGRFIRHEHLEQQFRAFLLDLPKVLTAKDKALQGAARAAGESLLAVSWMFLVAVAALLDGPAIARLAKRATPAAYGSSAQQMGALAYQAVGRSAAGSAFAALLQGGVVLVIALVLHIPLAPLLAANAAIWSFVPQVGGLLAGAPLVVVGLSQGLATGIAAGVLFVAYMVFNNHFLHAVIVGRAVGISPLASMVSVLVGASLGGFVGAMIATPLVSVAHTLVASRRSGGPGNGPASGADQADAPVAVASAT